MRLADVRTAMEHDDSGDLGDELRAALRVPNLARAWPKLVDKAGGDPDKAAAQVAFKARLELEPEPEPVPDVQGDWTDPDHVAKELERQAVEQTEEPR